MSTPTSDLSALTPAGVHEAVARLIGDGMFEVGECEIDTVSYRAFTHAPATLVDVLEAGRAHGDSVFLVHGDERWTFTEFFAAVDSLAAVLRTAYGIGVGDRVAIAMRNCPDWMIVFAAAAYAGAVIVPINSWGSSEELDFTLRNSGASILAADVPRATLAASTLAELGIPLILSEVDGKQPATGELADGVRLLRTLVDTTTPPAERTLPPVQPADVALLMYTSGSTGHPKGVMYRHVVVGQAMFSMMLTGFTSIELGEPAPVAGAHPEALLVTVPLFHATGLFSGYMLPCLLGQKVATMRKWDAATALRLIEAERITGLSTVPAILKELITHPDFDRHDLSSLRRTALGGAATPADLPDLVRDKLGVVARGTGYGMTETAALGATMNGAVYDLKPMAAGIVSPIVELRIAETDTDEEYFVGDGEIQMRGITVTPGYWQLDDVTRATFTDDGWLRTGDLGHVDDDGFLHVTGRIKELVIRGGENIAPIEIENIAYRHPAVKEVAVVGVPDSTLGEELAMVYHVVPGAALTEDELRAHLAAVLPNFKVPRDIRLSPEPLPRNASEKIHRLAIRRHLITQQGDPP